MSVDWDNFRISADIQILTSAQDLEVSKLFSCIINCQYAVLASAIRSIWLLVSVTSGASHCASPASISMCSAVLYTTLSLVVSFFALYFWSLPVNY